MVTLNHRYIDTAQQPATCDLTVSIAARRTTRCVQCIDTFVIFEGHGAEAPRHAGGGGGPGACKVLIRS